MSLAADLARSFSRYLRAANRSERAVTTYAEAPGQFTAYVTGLDDGPAAVADIDRSHVEGYLVELAQRGRSPATLNNRSRALRRFFDFLVAEEELADHPMSHDPTPGARPTCGRTQRGRPQSAARHLRL